MEAQETIDFIEEAKKNIGNEDFKVLYGKVKVEDDLLELESVYPISDGMKVLFASRRVLYPKKIKTSIAPIFIAIDIKGLLQAEEHNFVKSLGHPTKYREIEDKFVFLNMND